MATFKGSTGIVKVGANTVAEVTAFSFDQSAESIDDTELSDSWKTSLTDKLSWSGSVECHWDDTDTTGQGAMSIGSTVVIHLLVEGETTGDVDYTGSVNITGISINNGDGETIKASFSFEGAGALTIGAAA